MRILDLDLAHRGRVRFGKHICVYDWAGDDAALHISRAARGAAQPAVVTPLAIDPQQAGVPVCIYLRPSSLLKALQPDPAHPL